MKEPKFYQNWQDNNHCLQAAVMMALNTINEPVSWDDVNRMTRYEDGLYSWTPLVVTALANHIFDSRLISGMDYKQFAERGEEYLREYMSPRWFELQKAHASPGFKKEQTATKELVDKKLVEQRNIQVGDIEELLKSHLLIALVDAGKLAEENWSSGHFVVIYGQDKENFYINDPGLPPRKSWAVSKDKFKGAFKDELIIIPWDRE